MRKIILIMISVVALFAACKKPNYDLSPTGEGLGDFRLQSPASATNLVLNAATPTVPVTIQWTASKPGISMQPTYKWIAVLRSAGNFDAPYLSIPASNSGKDTKLTLTFKQIDDALLAKGVAAGAKVDLMWTVEAANESGTMVRSTDQFQISITRFADGASPFILLGPTSSTTNLEVSPTSTTDNFRFNWTKSNAASATNPVRYRVWFYKDDATMNPVFSTLSNTNGADTLLTISYKAMSDSLVKYGYTDFGAAAKLKWRVAATSGTWTQWSDYTNQIGIVRLVRMYLVGSINGWNINAPFEMVADKGGSRNGKVFYTYISLTPGDEFKFVKEVGNWGSAYGNTGGSAGSFTTGYDQGGNFSAPSAGVYRLTLDTDANRVYIQQKQVGVVGNMQGWNAGSPIFGGLAGRNRFIIIANSNGTDEFKFHDGTEWDNSAPNKSRWWGIGSAAGLLDNDGGGGNLVANSTPRTRAIWDATNPQQVKYELSSASQMRVVGDGINQAGVNDWDPPTSPQMTYSGNGVWTITLTLKGNKDIKFLAGAAWGAFDYEDGGAGAVAGQRKIVWDGSNNFKTPMTAGTYIITLNEHTQTVTIN